MRFTLTLYRTCCYPLNKEGECVAMHNSQYDGKLFSFTLEKVIPKNNNANMINLMKIMSR